MEIYSILLILLCHFIGDFCFQTNWMALNKSRYNEPLLVHAITYGLAFFPLVFLLKFNLFFSFVFLNISAHYFVDYLTSRWSSRYYQNGRIRAAFAVLGFDQLIHYFCLLLTFKFLIDLPLNLK